MNCKHAGARVLSHSDCGISTSWCPSCGSLQESASGSWVSPNHFEPNFSPLYDAVEELSQILSCGEYSDAETQNHVAVRLKKIEDAAMLAGVFRSPVHGWYFKQDGRP